MNMKNKGLPRPTKRRLNISSIQTDEEAFQPRFGERMENHVAGLSDVLRRGHELDPMSVWEDPDNGTIIVADGHHRLEAYRRIKPDAKVEVQVFRCDKHIAQMLPVADNAKNRLPLTYDEKANWAWKNDTEHGLSKKGIAQLCGISERTVATQRRVRKQLAGDGDSLPETWKEALRLSQGRDRGDWTDDERFQAMEAAVARADEQIGGTFTKLGQRWPEATAMFIERCLGKNTLEKVADTLGWVPITDRSDEAIGLLGMRIGEEFSEEEVDCIAAIAKEGPAF
ncbi:hypothetical protein FDP25_10275 [Roseovarius sp. A21]|uniref:ParB-like N-terminal domain-containing protein n=1 Tax=Roseovarius bejariae TaxID=2576383 RepID=A0A844CMF8_9RHOB|nr:ParB N-terminal domain-containing protein [Roseovarius bejariae]MRU15812.1 hypothetical protein [Roseovarius bejariae]